MFFKRDPFLFKFGLFLKLVHILNSHVSNLLKTGPTDTFYCKYNGVANYSLSAGMYSPVKAKKMSSPYMPCKAYKGGEVQLHSFVTSAPG